MDLELKKKNHSANHSIKTIINILQYVMGKIHYNLMSSGL